MKNDWLTASSFERTHEIVSAINTLSIHAKLVLAGIDDSANQEEVDKSRGRLLAFLNRFESLLRETELGRDSAVIGTDPRLGDLALRYLSEKRRQPRRSPLYEISLAQLIDLVRTERWEDLPSVISCLRGLRSLVEAHSHADVIGILGCFRFL